MNRLAKQKTKILLDYAVSCRLEEQSITDQMYAIFFSSVESALKAGVSEFEWQKTVIRGFQSSMRTLGLTIPFPFSQRVDDLNILSTLLLNSCFDKHETYNLGRRLAPYASPELQKLLLSLYSHESQNQDARRKASDLQRVEAAKKEGVLSNSQLRRLVSKDETLLGLVRGIQSREGVSYIRAIRLLLTVKR